MPDLEPPSKEAVSSVLSFYSSQLTSHTSMIVGFIVAFFTLTQVRESIVGTGALWLLQLGALTIASAAVYSMFRVVLYGSLSGVLTHCGVEEYRTYFSRQKVSLFEHAMVNGFATSQLLNKTTVRSVIYTLWGHDDERGSGRIWRVMNRLRGHNSGQGLITFWVQPPMILSFLVATLVVGVMFGWSADTFAQILGFLIFVVSLLVILSLRFAGPRRKGPSSSS